MPHLPRALRRLGQGLALALLASPALARDNPFPEIKRWFMPQATIMQRSYGTLASCAAFQDRYDARGWPKGVSFDTLKAIDRRLKHSVFLRPDEGVDTWTPLAEVVVEGARRPAADCDDVAVTGAQLAICAGFPVENLGLLVTQLPTRAKELHVVAFYNDPKQGVWIFADTMARPRPLSKLNQTVHNYAFIDDVAHWWALRDPLTGETFSSAAATSSLPFPAELDKAESGGTCRHPLPSEGQPLGAVGEEPDDAGTSDAPVR